METMKKKKKKKWSRKYNFCSVCGKNDRKHQARGVCSKCYQYSRREYKRIYNNKWYHAHPEKCKATQQKYRLKRSS